MKSILTILFSFLFIVLGFSQTRNVVVDTNGVVVQPTNIWTANATNARSGLGLGSAATNPASAFQPASTVLSNLASSNGASLTNIAVSNVVGALATNGNAINLTNFPASLLRTNGNGFGLTNLNVSNITGTLPLISGGTGATNASDARNNLGLGTAATNPATSFQPSSSVLSNLASGNGINLTNIQATNIVGTISVTNIAGSSYSNNIQNFVSDVSNATNTVTNSRNVTVYSIFPTVNTITNTVQLPTNNAIVGDLAKIIHTGPTNSLTRIRKIGEITNLVTLNQSSESVDFIYDGTNWSILPNNAQTTPIYFSGDNATSNAAISRTNLGLGATWLTNTNVTNFRTAIGLGTTNYVIFSEVAAQSFSAQTNIFEIYKPIWIGDSGTNDIFQFETGDADRAKARTNLGLGWSALTNSNAGTRLVSVDSNGSVVSPTNFWQSAPIASSLQTIVQTFTPTTNSTNAATNARNVYVYSLATNVSGITNTVTLPTNTATINGDNITVIHQGLTNTTTAIRKLGQTNNLITINKFDEAVKFIYENGDWAFYHNISFVDPIQFSGTNASANMAASRTNLGLGATWLTNTNVTNFRTAIGLGATNDVRFNSISVYSDGEIESSIAAGVDGLVFKFGTNSSFELGGGIDVFYRVPIRFNNTTNAATTRTNLGVPSSFGSGSNSVIGGGLSNTSSGLQSVVGGGLGNTASGQNSFVGGGSANVASSFVSVVAGGSQNQALGAFNGIVGGTRNIIDYAEYSFIGGGDSNKIVAVNGGGSNPLQSASIVGGWQNSILQNTNLASLSSWSFIGGGKTNNIIDSSYASIVSGSFNVINNTSPNSSIVSGNGNSINNSGQSFIGNGSANSINGGFRSTIVNGSWNFASNNFSTVINGEYSVASADYSLASGRKAKATNGGSFVFTDSQDADFSSTNDNSFNARFSGGMFLDLGTNGISFANSTSAAVTRSNLGIGGTNSGTFSNLVNNGNFTNNGLIYVFATNIGAFEGLANLINSNNTTLSNETLFRVGLAEATNRSAQFGFRVARTNNGGEGLAVFSVYGYNALMMIGPSDRSRTNTATNAAIEADIFSISDTNKVMTLVTTNTGATLFHRPIEFNNTTNQAVTRTNIGLGGGITTNIDVKLDNNAGMRLYFNNGILTNSVTPIP